MHSVWITTTPANDSRSRIGARSPDRVLTRNLARSTRSSNRHWHEKEDEFLYVLSGEVTVVEEDGAHLLIPGDAACWPAGCENAHQVANRSTEPCSFLVVGTKLPADIVRYPDLKRTLFYGDGKWRVVDDETGSVLREGLE